MKQLRTLLLYLLLRSSLSNSEPNHQTPLLHQPSSILPTTPLFALHRTLVSIPSISGNESAISHYLTTYLSSLNLTVEVQPIAPLSSSSAPRSNILAYPGTTRATRILLTSHLDTVPPYYPYRITPGHEIWGRGSVDAKGSIAAQITAFTELHSSHQIYEGDVSLLFVVDEELGGNGMRHFNSLDLTYSAVIFGEPTAGKLACGHKGALDILISAKGKAGHSGYPWLGENANSMLIPALLAFERMQLPQSGKYGASTVNIGRMQGGVAGNVIAEQATAEVQVRIAGGGVEEVREEVRRTVGSVDKRLEVEFVGGYGPVGCDCDVEGLYSYAWLRSMELVLDVVARS